MTNNKMKNKLIKIILPLASISFIASCSILSTSNDADNVVPAALQKEATWQLQPQFSDEFNYEGKNKEFLSKWKDGYMSKWKGPGLTDWSANNSTVTNGNLVLLASRKQGTKQVNAGIITSKAELQYPAYMEAKIKVANQVLSSNFWLLSKDSKREIDVLEIYGSDRADHQKVSTHASNNYHIFMRNPKNNSIIKDISLSFKKGVLANNAPFRDGYHRFGAYWKDAWNIEFYLDGKFLRKLTKADIKDPDGVGFDRAMHLILDLEDHDWRSKRGHIATDEELADETKNKMYIDWIRVYKPAN